MELQGNVTIAAKPAEVWLALNDPQVLQGCIPGCDEVRQISPTEMHARVGLKLGPVRAQFVGKVFLSDVRPEQGYTLQFEGSGGSAGFAKGSSRVALQAVAAGTELTYSANASVAGKLGQIGGRMIDATAQSLAAKFFANLQAHFAPEQFEPTHLAAGKAGSALPAGAGHKALSGKASSEWTRLVWFVAGVLATSLGVWLGSHLGR
jgi:carbon monoxide dehydrogenase subunit G